ncbi:MAG: hemerythrin domain-containing protein [Nitrososphaerales archaeon]
MSYKEIDFSEPIPKMVERLIIEHRELAPKLDEIERAAEENPPDGIDLLEGVATKILRHAVEEEARVMRVIMKDAKAESSESVRIMQEHRWISEFLERRLKTLPNVTRTEARSEIKKFVTDLGQHFREEEEIVFPLALRAEESEHT